MIPGPRDQPELENFFETKQTLNAQSLSNEFNIKHLEANSFEQLKANIELFLESEHTSLLEI
ncbi:2-succinyl-5-enolpyruvyl-6-hydroxy-3-cyclohexene-1-carboxylic-acid synthase, partial [Marivirga lumbricoides]